MVRIKTNTGGGSLSVKAKQLKKKKKRKKSTEVQSLLKENGSVQSSFYCALQILFVYLFVLTSWDLWQLCVVR